MASGSACSVVTRSGGRGCARSCWVGPGSSWPTPEGESAFNFTPQVGAGVQYLLTRRTALGLEYRLHHISNKGLTPDNPGINNHQVILTLSWY